MMNVEIAQRLAELRRERGFSQEGLAEQLGLSRQAVSKWERAESAPDMGNLIALADLYGVTLDELLRVSPEVEEDVRYESQERAASSEAQAAEAAEEAREAAERAEAAAVAVAAQEAPPQKVVVEVNAPTLPPQSVGTMSGMSHASANGGAPGAPVVGVPGASSPMLGAGAPGTPACAPGYQVAPVQQPFPPAAAVPITPPAPPEPKDPLRSFPYPLLCAVLFLLAGFCFGWWHPAWVIFLTIPFYYWVVNTLEADPAYRAWVEERRQAAAAVSSANAAAGESGARPASAEGCAASSEEASAEASSVEGGAR